MVFSLAGLLRLRHLEQEQAEGALADANARVAENAARQAQIRRKLGGTDNEVASVDVLRAVAAARASSRSMLAELDATLRQQEHAANEAREAYSAARSRSKGLERLEEKHSSAVDAAERHTEQAAIDEIATGIHSRGGDKA
ncbi:flagellar export protein FliJ [Glaciibacter psychrotolerans]|uniref:Flagellar FliJ protein n=1 Tax=Glaciibacter psychrotolerans TaxID=670054 RepID=A0A7Z0EBT4_9MICO|nr:flagellar FliJ family protein [Leifsonia psychrotolerans]NYJ18762.1 flagellar FliJ protein [Leifsonia psychrotolerans]